MELIKKFKKLICFHSESITKPNFLDREALTLENTFDQIDHLEKRMLLNEQMEDN